jgi:hypothetical protein
MFSIMLLSISMFDGARNAPGVQRACDDGWRCTNSIISGAEKWKSSMMTYLRNWPRDAV